MIPLSLFNSSCDKNFFICSVSTASKVLYFDVVYMISTFVSVSKLCFPSAIRWANAICMYSSYGVAAGAPENVFGPFS